MGLYSKYVLPRVVTLTCGLKPYMRQCEKVIPQAKGHVLEVGIGSGLNLQFYDEKNVEHIWGVGSFQRDLTNGDLVLSL